MTFTFSHFNLDAVNRRDAEGHWWGLLILQVRKPRLLYIRYIHQHHLVLIEGETGKRTHPHASYSRFLHAIRFYSFLFIFMISCLLAHNKLPQSSQGKVVINIFYLTHFLWVRRSLAGWFGWAPLMRLCSDGSWGHRHLQCWLDLEGSVPGWLTQRAGEFVNSCWRCQISAPNHMNLSMGQFCGCLQHGSRLLLDRVIQERERARRKPQHLLWVGIRNHTLSFLW